MDDVRTTRPAGATSDHEVLDEDDPHAGDDADWSDALVAALVVPDEPSPLLFWRGLLLGLLLSAAAWCVLAAAAFGLYELIAR